MDDFYSADRIENGYAVLVNGEETVDVPLKELEGGVSEGDMFVKNARGRFVRDNSEQAMRRKKLAERTRRLMGRKGDEKNG